MLAIIIPTRPPGWEMSLYRFGLWACRLIAGRQGPRVIGDGGAWGIGTEYCLDIIYCSILSCRVLSCLVIGRQASTRGQYIVINGTPYKPASLPYAAMPVQYAL